MVRRVMPATLNLGRPIASSMATPLYRRKKWIEAGRPSDPFGRRLVMGFALPSWQRPLVWTEQQKVRFLESAWLGLYLGTYTYNQTYGSELDDLLIDGQQRMWALECYLSDEFPVFGYRWSEVTDVDARRFEMLTLFHSFVTETKDEDYLRRYYDLMNFGGTPHTESQRAIPA